MKSTDIFGLVVRVTGFFIAIWSLWNLWAGFQILLETAAQTTRPPGDQYSPLSYFGMGMPALAVGALCLLCADRIVKAAYRDK